MQHPCILYQEVASLAHWYICAKIFCQWGMWNIVNLSTFLSFRPPSKWVSCIQIKHLCLLLQDPTLNQHVLCLHYSFILQRCNTYLWPAYSWIRWWHDSSAHDIPSTHQRLQIQLEKNGYSYNNRHATITTIGTNSWQVTALPSGFGRQPKAKAPGAPTSLSHMDAYHIWQYDFHLCILEKGLPMHRWYIHLNFSFLSTVLKLD